MCFDVKKGDKAAKIAATDIPCFKVLRVNGKSLHSPSPFSKPTTWKAGQAKKCKELVRYGVKSINEGLHSMKTFSATKSWTQYNDRRKVFKAIIPAGSIYWENATQYVSDTLTIVSNIPVTPQRKAKKK